MVNAERKYLVVGLGVSGMSVVRYLARTHCYFEVAETNAQRWQEKSVAMPELTGITCHADPLTAEILKRFNAVVVSPGVSVRSAMFSEAQAAGVEIIGDVELFAREVKKPVIAVTGSNGKSTVVNMAGAVLEAAGINAAVIGNIGYACLDSLQDDSIDAYVIELSSFQLETTFSLKPLAATVLNVCADHLDRYNGIEDYAEVKRRIYHGAKHVVMNADDKLSQPVEAHDSITGFSVQRNSDWAIKQNSTGNATLSGGNVAAVPASVVSVAGVHNQANALAAMALTEKLISADKAALSKTFSQGLAGFSGLPHRTSLVCSAGNVDWINDSKGTNVGAAVSAIKGMGVPVVLIAGGRGKNADYEPLREAVEQHCTSVVLIGEDAEKIDQALNNSVPVYRESSMTDAVQRAARVARPGDCVLLSPACASFDMFQNFEERGVVFESEVKKLCA